MTEEQTELLIQFIQKKMEDQNRDFNMNAEFTDLVAQCFGELQKKKSTDPDRGYGALGLAHVLKACAKLRSWHPSNGQASQRNLKIKPLEIEGDDSQSNTS